MKLSIFVLALTAAVAAPCCRPAAAAVLPAPQLHAQMQMPWDQPPPEFKEVERKGFHAGVEAAVRDYDHHRSPEPERRKEFRHPNVERSFQEDYRKGFLRGYNDAYRHLMKSNGRHS